MPDSALPDWALSDPASVGPPLARHDLVRVAPAAWTLVLAGRPDLAEVPHLPGWAEAGRPLIVRRYGPGEDRASVPLGLPLPPRDGKRRIGLALPADRLGRVPAPTLASVRAAAPAAWQAALDALVALGAVHGCPPRPFGGLLWQGLTGLPYLTATSDLDLLWPLPRGGVDLAALLAGIAAIARTAPMRIDGEVLLPDGAGIQWRELTEAPAGGQVLAKALDRLSLRAVADLLPRAAA